MMMRNFVKFLPLFFSMLFVSCIENDLSFPKAMAEIASMEVEGQKSVTIDAKSRTVTVVLEETADISRLKVKSFTVTHDAQVLEGIPQYLDLSKPVQLTLRVYEDFVWTIEAVQPIERYIRCDNQIGEAYFEPDRKYAVVYVSNDQPLMAVRFNDMKLEPVPSKVIRTTGTVIRDGQSVSLTENCNFPDSPMVLDCATMRYFYVEYKGQEMQWSVVLLQKEIEVDIEAVSAWTYSVAAKGMTNGKGTAAFEYRKASENEWTRYEDVSLDGYEVSAEIGSLEEGTDYMIRLTNGTSYSREISFRTGEARQLQNLSFDNWYLNGKAWIPNAETGDYVWDTANPGTAGLGYVPTTPEERDVVKGKAARLETQLAGILGIEKLAAGNIYTGRFGKIAGVGAELQWGVPFTDRPLALRGYLKYAPKTIDRAESPYMDKKGATDECQVQIFLTDWSEPFLINTSKKQFVDFSDPLIIARGEYTSDKTHEDYIEFTVPLVYRDHRTPKYIVVSGAASRYGDYFTGGVGSVLLLDEFELVYDPEELTEEEYRTVFSMVDPV